MCVCAYGKPFLSPRMHLPPRLEQAPSPSLPIFSPILPSSPRSPSLVTGNAIIGNTLYICLYRELDPYLRRTRVNGGSVDSVTCHICLTYKTSERRLERDQTRSNPSSLRFIPFSNLVLIKAKDVYYQLVQSILSVVPLHWKRHGRSPD
jgi:hypothetical protein